MRSSPMEAGQLLSFGTEIFSPKAPQTPLSEAGSDSSDNTDNTVHSEASTQLGGGNAENANPPVKVMAPTAALLHPRPTRASLLREKKAALQNQAAAQQPAEPDAVVGAGVTPKPRRTSRASAASLTSPASSTAVTPRPALEASPLPAAASEFHVQKRGVPWRGTYARVLRVGGGVVATLDPANGCATNEWKLDRGDVVRAEAEPDGGGSGDSVVVHVGVAPWPGAPAWLAQRVSLVAPTATADAALAALAAANVPISRR